MKPRLPLGHLEITLPAMADGAGLNFSTARGQFRTHLLEAKITANLSWPTGENVQLVAFAPHQTPSGLVLQVRGGHLHGFEEAVVLACWLGFGCGLIRELLPQRTIGMLELPKASRRPECPVHQVVVPALVFLFPANVP
jgi:hypothetical protein